MLEVLPPPDPDGLRKTVSPALADYRIWKHNLNPAAAFHDPVPAIRNAFPRWYIPKTTDLATEPLSEALTRDGHWHLQIYIEDDPTFYARVRRVRETWIVEWLGEAWLANDVRDGLAFLEPRVAELEGELRLVSSRLYKFSSFWLPEGDQHLVVSASSRLKPQLPLLTFISGARLSQILLDTFGAQHGAGVR